MIMKSYTLQQKLTFALAATVATSVGIYLFEILTGAATAGLDSSIPSQRLTQLDNQLRWTIGGGILLLLVSMLMHLPNRFKRNRMRQEQRLVSDSIDEINEGFILLNTSGHALVVNATVPKLLPDLAEQLETDTYKEAMERLLGSSAITQLGRRQTHKDESEKRAALKSVDGHRSEYRTAGGLFLRVSEKNLRAGGQVITFTDITDLKKIEDKLHRQANYDYLTGIANRNHFLQRLEESIERAKRTDRKVALMQFDLDKFKQVNDTLGHAVGDELLVETARRIKDNLRQIDLAARTGGDEFVAIIDQITDQSEAIVSAERILAELYQELEIDGMQVDFSASIGIAIFPDHAQDSTTLMQHSDLACYRAKEQGRNNYQIYGSDLKVQAVAMVTLESRLRKAIDEDSLFVTYQPHLHLESNELQYVEAFSRWHDEQLGTVSPDQFIPIAEKNGLITRLGDQVMRKVFAQLKLWQAQGFDKMQVAVNVSQRQLYQPQFVDSIVSLSEEYQVDTKNLLLEIKEQVIAEHNDTSKQRLVALAEHNIRFVLDDYGVGSSSLLNIRNLPIYALKIDGGFIRRITTDEPTREIVRAMISSAKNLQLDTIAECVETAEEAALLKQMGCTMIQGYFVGSPKTSTEVVKHYHAQYLRDEEALKRA